MKRPIYIRYSVWIISFRRLPILCFWGWQEFIRAEELLKVFAHKYPASELYIHIEGDEAIQENNGYYTVRDGFCFRERVRKKYHTYTLDGFTRLLLEAEHPYMSLMLN